MVVVKKRRLLIAFGLILFLDVISNLYYASERRTLLEEIKEVRVDGIEETDEKELIQIEQPEQWVVSTSKRLFNVIWLGLIVWLGLMVWMIFVGIKALLLWLIWLCVGLLNVLFGILYHVKGTRKI